MYSDQDMKDINARIRKSLTVLVPVAVLLLGVYVYALAARVQWLAMAAGPLLFVALCYGLLAKLLPNLRYRRFLRDMEVGLSRDIEGTILAVSGDAELQDGAMVLPVRLLLEEDGEHAASMESTHAHRLAVASGEDVRNERVVYLNASKRDLLPGPGSKVKLHCFGRHIRSVETL